LHIAYEKSNIANLDTVNFLIEKGGMKLEYKEDNGGESATYIPIKRKFPFELQVKLYSLKPVPRTKFSNDEIVQWDRIVHRYSIGIS